MAKPVERTRSKAVFAPRILSRALRRATAAIVEGAPGCFARAVSARAFPKGFQLSQAYGQRSLVLGVCLGAGFIALLGRYAYLGLLPNGLRDRLLQQASRQFETEVTLAPPRAQIVDRNGRTLAVSVLFPSLFVVPRRIPDDPTTQRAVARALGVPHAEIASLAKSNKAFAWLRRQIPPADFARVGDLANWQEFVGVIDEPKRLYPEKDLAAHLIGFVGTDAAGLEGAEKIYDDVLNGAAVKAKVTRDARGRVTLIAPSGAVRPEPTSEPLRLSIDLSIQSFVEAALREGVTKARARGGSAVVMNVETGELLAIASWPTYDLNAPPSDPARRRFRPIMDALELGSVVKPLFVAAALDRGLVKEHERIDCLDGSMRVPGGAIKDDHPQGLSTPSEIIKHSSNICTYRIVQRLGREAFAEIVRRYGLARYPGTGLPGEWQGRIGKPDTWREMRFANMAFGQGIAISPLQMTKALAILSGGGVDRGIRILAQDGVPYPSEDVGPPARVISAETSRLVTRMMMTVVEEEGGTGRRASIPGLNVAGKTGTAEKFMQSTKSYSERIASFTGVVPAEAPKLAITVVIDEPQVRPAYGGTLAGPVFSEIGQKTMSYLNSVGELAIHGAEHDTSL